MTYRKLIDALSRQPDTRLDDPVKLLDSTTGEFISIHGVADNTGNERPMELCSHWNYEDEELFLHS